MMNICHNLRSYIAGSSLTAGLGMLLLTLSPAFAQSDRSERLQERVNASEGRLDARATPVPINSLAQQALRKARERFSNAQAKLVKAQAMVAKRKNYRSPAEDRDTRQVREQLSAAQAELNAANAKLRAAEEAACLEKRQ
jgi:hypothetical protein